MERVNFHFDPVCPWAWLTSRWITRLEELGEVEVEWRLFSLGVVNREPDQDLTAGPFWYSGEALQMLSLARRQGGNQLVARLYTELGRGIHVQGEPIAAPATIEAAMARAGMDPTLRESANSDRSLWQEVLADHDQAVASCQAFGVPTIILDGGNGPGGFGPVITEVPPDQEARELLADVVRMLRRDYVFEFKRDRDGHPPQLAGSA